MERMVTMSLKIYNATPSQLPKRLRDELMAVVCSGLLPESFCRPGCVAITLDLYRCVPWSWSCTYTCAYISLL